jgi:CRISPR/Cas system CMR-associated protein Cmr1 (group 7 of RAMP superfamily)
MLGLKYVEGAIPGKNNKRKQSLTVITEEGKKEMQKKYEENNADEVGDTVVDNDSVDVIEDDSIVAVLDDCG